MKFIAIIVFTLFAHNGLASDMPNLSCAGKYSAVVDIQKEAAGYYLVSLTCQDEETAMIFKSVSKTNYSMIKTEVINAFRPNGFELQSESFIENKLSMTFLLKN